MTCMGYLVTCCKYLTLFAAEGAIEDLLKVPAHCLLLEASSLRKQGNDTLI